MPKTVLPTQQYTFHGTENWHSVPYVLAAFPDTKDLHQTVRKFGKAPIDNFTCRHRNKIVID